MNKKAVVVFAYKRPLTLSKVLFAVNSYAPSCLYLVVDYPSNEQSALLVDNVKQLISTFIFKPKVLFIYPPEHQGVINIFEYALNIVFEKESQAIILEDDTIPSPQFFKYCEQMLEKYENNSEIGSIIGTNLGAMQDTSNFCTVPIGMPFWGWATWADRWKLMPKDYSFWDNFILTKDYDGLNSSILKPLLNSFDNNRKVPKSWDLKWAMYQLSMRMECVIPGSNLISNKGYNELATFTKIENSAFENLPIDINNYSNSSFLNSDQNLKHTFLQKQLLFLNEFANRKTL